MNLESRIQELLSEKNSREVEVLIDDLRNYTLVSNEDYEDLVSDANFMYCLESAGVDNWEGYDIARQMYREENPK